MIGFKVMTTVYDTGSDRIRRLTGSIPCHNQKQAQAIEQALRHANVGDIGLEVQACVTVRAHRGNITIPLDYVDILIEDLQGACRK